MSLNYSTYQAALGQLMVISDYATNTDFQTILPDIIDYAEQRIYRELDLLATRSTALTGAFVPNQRTFSLPQTSGPFIQVEEFNVYTPAGTFSTRVPLTQASMPFINTLWPTDTATSTTSVPAYYAMLTDQTGIVGPPPGDSFSYEVTGPIRPQPLSATNTQTVLSLYLPDLFLAASMIFASGYQKNFGGQSDNPQMAQSWESQYMLLFNSANKEELRRKFGGQSWVGPAAQPEGAAARQ